MKTPSLAGAMMMKGMSKPISMDAMPEMSSKPFQAKNGMSESELESLVAKMKQINKDIDEVSDDQMRQMITQGMTSESPEKNDDTPEDRPNENDMDSMNIMKPVDRFVDSGKPTNGSAAKGGPAIR